jgi:hypothetical protein
MWHHHQSLFILLARFNYAPAFSPNAPQVNAQLQILAREQRRADLTFQGGGHRVNNAEKPYECFLRGGGAVIGFVLRGWSDAVLQSCRTYLKKL